MVARLLICALVAAPAPAAAEPVAPSARPGLGGADPREPYRLAATARPLTLPAGLCQASLVAEANLAARRELEPLSVAPDLYCAAGSGLTVGFTHSARALSRVDIAPAFCLTGDAASAPGGAGCRRLYDGVAFDLLYTPRPGAALAARARLSAGALDPFLPALHLGALVRLGGRARGRAVALLVDPHVSLGLAGRAQGNRDQVGLPVWLQVQAGSHLLFHLHTGARGELAVLADAFAIPVGLGAALSPTCAWDIVVEGAFPRLFGPQNTVRERQLTVAITYRPAIARPRSPATWCTAD